MRSSDFEQKSTYIIHDINTNLRRYYAIFTNDNHTWQKTVQGYHGSDKDF